MQSGRHTMEYHGVVFDVDDTLYDMSLPFIGAYERLYEKRYGKTM